MFHIAFEVNELPLQVCDYFMSHIYLKNQKVCEHPSCNYIQKCFSLL
jgi:hypothetical protein